MIGWRGLAQQDPLNEYKREAFQLFDELITQLRETTTSQLNRVEIAFEQPEAQMVPPMQAAQFEPMNGNQDDLRDLMMRLGNGGGNGDGGRRAQRRHRARRAGRARGTTSPP